MFSHPAAPPPPQQPQDSKVAGAPALDADWAAAVTRWEPATRPASPAQWSWLRWAWEQLDGRLPETPGDGAAEHDEAVLDASLALLAAFLEVADGQPLSSPAQAQTPDGNPLRGAENGEAVAQELAAQCGTTLCFAQLWSLARPQELQEDPWAELSGQGHDGAAEDPAAQPRDVAGEEAQRRPLFPLSGDDIAWIVSGSMTVAKDRTWQWFSRIASGSAQD